MQELSRYVSGHVIGHVIGLANPSPTLKGLTKLLKRAR